MTDSPLPTLSKVKTTPRIATTLIDGAVVELWRNDDGSYLRYQVRDGAKLKWWAVMYDTGMDGWGGEVIWAETKEAALDEAKDKYSRATFAASPIYPDTGGEAIGWTPEQIGKAVVWASEAERFSFKQAAE
jgi:hypothetical protein